MMYYTENLELIAEIATLKLKSNKAHDLLVAMSKCEYHNPLFNSYPEHYTEYNKRFETAKLDDVKHGVEIYKIVTGDDACQWCKDALNAVKRIEKYTKRLNDIKNELGLTSEYQTLNSFDVELKIYK